LARKSIFDELESELLQDLLRSTKPVQQPYPPVIVGGFRLAARRAIRYGDGILPAAPSAGSGSPEDFMLRFREMARKPAATPRR
jgi:alkanesulfonate monooxygenase SsuD/methylene tetrahydromethanopterin reductase-like flavin-dependent oxidoreductase (luciferase family)